MDRSYRVTVDSQGLVASGRSLFEACLCLKGVSGSNVVTPEGRLVAFWCGHRNRVAPGFGAHPHEREQIVADFGFEPLS